MAFYDVVERVPFKTFTSAAFGKEACDPYALLRAGAIGRDYAPRYFDSGKGAVFSLFSRKLAGRKVVFPGFICPYIVRAAVKAGAVPVFADADLDTFNMKPEPVGKALDEGASAVFAVHTFGVPCGIWKIRKMCEKEDAMLIEDVAHALYADTGDGLAGAFGDYTLVSMYKQIPNFGGAVLLCPEKTDMEQPEESAGAGSILKKVGGLHQAAVDALRKRSGLGGVSGNDGADVEPKGPGELAAAVFCRSLPALKEKAEKRREIAKAYAGLASKSGYFIAQGVPEGCASSYYNFSIRLKPEFAESRDGVLLELRKKGIFCDRLWFDCPAVLPEFEGHAGPGGLPNAELLAKSVVNLPIRETYSRADAERLFSELEGAAGKVVK